MNNNPDLVGQDDDMRKEYDFTNAVRGKYVIVFRRTW